MNTWLTPADVCERLAINKRALAQLITSEEIMHLRISKNRVRFSEEMVQDFIERNTKGASV